MRIEFPNAAREDFHWAHAQLRIGSAPDNDLVLAANQAAAQHLRIQQDRRGWVLQVLPLADRIYVNARPVQERALLRAGDVVSVGDCRMLLRADQDPTLRPPLSVLEQGRCTVALRAVAGPLSGHVLPLQDSMELGPQGRCPLELPQGDVATLRIFWDGGQLLLEATQPSARHPLRVNGVAVQKLALQPGDQIGLAMHRFVVEAPGMEAEPEIVMPEPPPVHLPEEAAGPTGEVWWLIVTAAVLALGIALVLLIRF
ncbi:MAG TPA: FHA domain-containing protein [Rhodanobacter sp.]|nr:FHA domain-containing protein [Rhodanobacter sp.]